MTKPSQLRRGDLLPRIVTGIPGPRALHLSERLRRFEAPGVNTLYQDQPNIVWQEARGSNVIDVDGNRYIDLTSGFGVAAIGHRHPRIVAAMRRQSSRLVHGLGDATAHPVRIDLAEKLHQRVPIDEAQTYFAISGSDAIEIAIKTALLATGRNSILVFDPSYHGLTLGALAATSRGHFRDPFSSHIHSRIQRLPYACDPSLIEKNILKNPDLACTVVEPIVGREGVIVPPDGWLKELESLCKKHHLLLIVDEIFTGFGRTGHLFAVEREGVQPDLLCCGKAMAGGLPIGAVVGSKSLMNGWKTSGEAIHTATFLANPLSCAAALATLDLFSEEDILYSAKNLSLILESRLENWNHLFQELIQIRGRFLLWGVEFAQATQAAEFVHQSRRRGILLLAGGPDGRVAQLVPALNISQRQLETALDLLEESLHEIYAAC